MCDGLWQCHQCYMALDFSSEQCCENKEEDLGLFCRNRMMLHKS